MPPSGALGGLPVVSIGCPLDPISPPAGPSLSYGLSVIPQEVSVTPPGILFMATFANLLPLAASTIPPTPMGMYIGDGPPQSLRNWHARFGSRKTLTWWKCFLDSKGRSGL